MQGLLETRDLQEKKDLTLSELLLDLDRADAARKSEIENIIVNMGSQVVPELVEMLQVLKGTVRGVIAMILIRIGKDSVDYLQHKARLNSDFKWIAQYLTSEILGTSMKAA